MRVFGLIGGSLSHSFSKSYFEEKFRGLGISECVYRNFEVQNLESFIQQLSEIKNLCGFNVTLPYKESILPYIHHLSAEAREIGAVNCVKINHSGLAGYNTDVYGFSQSIKPFLDRNHQRALVLGGGGASKAVVYALKKLGIDVYLVTRSEKKSASSFFYNELNEHIMQAFKLVVNCTPVGTFPQTNQCPTLPYDNFTPEHLAYDLVYNPEQSLFLKKAAEKGAITVNGLSMLQLQAEKSWEIWNANDQTN